MQVLYKYKAQKPDPEQRRAEGSRTLKNYPSKVPVGILLGTNSKLFEDELLVTNKESESFLILQCVLCVHVERAGGTG